MPKRFGLSGRFTGHLRGAEILHAGANRSIVGIKTNIEGQPQHCLFLGMTGAGSGVKRTLGNAKAVGFKI
jgi:hypothetical protein